MRPAQIEDAVRSVRDMKLRRLRLLREENLKDNSSDQAEESPSELPIILSILNGFSGLCTTACGFLTDNQILTITGAVLGVSGFGMAEKGVRERYYSNGNDSKNNYMNLLGLGLANYIPSLLFGSEYGGLDRQRNGTMIKNSYCTHSDDRNPN